MVWLVLYKKEIQVSTFFYLGDEDGQTYIRTTFLVSDHEEHVHEIQMGFMERGLASGGQESPGLCLVQLCAKYRLVSTKSSLYH